jgi:hypothetical protein
VPKHDAFNRSFNRLTPATLKAINDLVVGAAVKLGVEDGSKLRERRAYERSPAFKQGQRFRAGIEGRISVLMRGRGIYADEIGTTDLSERSKSTNFATETSLSLDAAGF